MCIVRRPERGSKFICPTSQFEDKTIMKNVEVPLTLLGILHVTVGDQG